jgi:WD40 repeat protein
LPEPTIGPDTLARLHPLRAFGLGGARKVAIAPGGKILAVATTAGVALFELPTLRHLRFDQIDGGAWQLAWSPNGQQLAVATRGRGAQRSTSVYHVVDGSISATLPGDEPTWSRDGQTLATSQCISECHTTLTRAIGTPAVTLDGHEPILSPDGRTIVTYEYVNTGGDEGLPTTRLWNADGVRLVDFPGIHVLEFSPDSRIIAMAPLATHGQRATTTIRRTSDGTVIRTLDGDPLAFSHDGAFLAVTDGISVSLWRRQDLDTAGGQPMRTFAAPITEASPWGNALSFSPDDQVLHAVLGHSLYSWRVVDGTPLGTTPNASAESVTFPAHGAILSLVAAGGDGPATTTLIDTLSGAPFYQGQANDISFGDDNSTITLFRFDGIIQVLGRGSSDGPTLDLPAYTDVAFSPDAQTMALSSYHTLSFWDVVDSARKQELGTGMDSLFDDVSNIGLRYGSDGRQLIYEAQRDNIYDGLSALAITWDVASGQQVYTAGSGKVKNTPQVQQMFRWAFSPQGAAAFFYGAGQVEIQAGSGVSVTVTTPVTVTALAFNPGGSMLAIGDSAGAVRLVNTADGSDAGMLQAGGAVRGLFFSPDGTLLAAARADGPVPVWQVGQPEPIGTLAGSPGDGKLIFTADNQLAIRVSAHGLAFYRLPDGVFLYTPPIAAEDIAIGPRRQLLAVLHDGRVMLWGVRRAAAPDAQPAVP